MEMLLRQGLSTDASGLAKGADSASGNCIITVELAKADGIRGEAGQPRYIERMLVSGWVVCKEQVEKILFDIDGITLGVATHGIFRPDVGSAYPGFNDPNHAGFTAILENIPLNIDSIPSININVVTKMGRRYSGKLRLQAPGGAASTVPTQRQVVSPSLSLAAYIDIAEIDSNNGLLIRGWAVAPVEIVAIQVIAGNSKLGLATMGLDRSDVAENYPQYPGARRSGFEFQAALTPNQSIDLKSIQVEMIARNGEVKTISAELARVKTREQVAAERSISNSDETVANASAVAESSIRWSCDVAEITKRGVGYVTGWAVSPAGVRSISMYVGGRTVGSARLGLSRDDVGAVMPEIANSAISGYEIRFDLGQLVDDAAGYVLRIEDNNGDALETTISMQIRDSLSREIEASPEMHRGAAEDFRINLDSPGNREGMASEPITGAVTVTGWALARQGLQSVSIYFGGALVGKAKLGMRRPDIGSLFPDWPNSLLSGFSLFVPASVLKNGQQQLTIELMDKQGSVRNVQILVDVQKKAAGEGEIPLRRKVSAVESDLNKRIVSGAGCLAQFNLVIPVPDWLSARDALPLTLRSLAAQTYPDWRLFLVPLNVKDRKLLAELNSQIPADIFDKVQILTRLDGSFASLDMELANLSGAGNQFSYIANLHVGDELAVDALLQVALSNVGETAADFIYGDERRESPVTNRIQMFLKPGWSPQLLLSSNYIGRCWFAMVDVVDVCYPSMAEFVKASEYDRVLRITEDARNVRRVPRVLTERHGEQFEVEKVELQALAAAARRRGIQASIEKGAVLGTYRFHRKLVTPGKVSIIIPSIAARGLVKICLESIKTKSTYSDYEIVLIDNIRDESSQWKPWFKENADKVIEVWEDYNWSYFNNIGAYHATGEYLVFLNDDIEVIEPRWMEAMMEISQVEDVGVVGAYLLYPDRSVQHAGIFLSGPGTGRHAFRFAPEDDPGYFGFALTQRDMMGVTGACIMVRREVFDAVGGFNEAHSIINNDLDFCLRCHDTGLSTVYTPYARLIHHELASREKLPETYDVAAFSEEWGQIFAKGDPFFHPGLSRSDDYYSVDQECLREVYAGYPIAHKSEIRRIVAFKLDHIGDFITALPAIRRLKEHFPACRLSVVVGPAVTALAKTEPAIDEVFDFAFFHARSGLGQKDVSENDLMALKAHLSPYQFDLAVDLRKHLDTRHVLQYSGAKLYAGFDQANKFPWLDFVLEWEGDPTWVNKHQHVAGDLLNLVDAIANGCKENRNTIHLAEGAAKVKLPVSVAKFSKTLYGRPVIGIHPASGNELRQWPAEHFADLIDLLISRLPVHIAILGGPDEMELANAVLARVKQRQFVWSLVGAHKLNELPAVLQSLALFVGNNSGPKHVAAGLGVPTVAIHSAVVSTEEWGPLGLNAVALRKDMGCAPCYRASLEDCHRNIACLREISPEEVYQTCLRFLALSDQKNLNGIK